MKGYIESYNREADRGEISADNGKKYTFRKQDIHSGEFPQAGMLVDFLTENDQAKEIYILDSNTQMANVPFYEDQPKGLKALFSANGCFTRKDYWLVSLGTFFVLVILSLILMFIIDQDPESPLAYAYYTFFVLSIFVIAYINIVTSIKRFHDINKSGWFYLLSLIPYVGGIILLVMNGFLPSVTQNNIYCRRKKQA